MIYTVFDAGGTTKIFFNVVHYKMRQITILQIFLFFCVCFCLNISIQTIYI